MADLHASVEEYLAGLSDEDWRALSARVRPPMPTDPVTARASIAHKAGQLLAVERDENGPVGSFSAAVAARAPQQSPQPEQPTPQQH
jgi:hypothetical protein